MEEVVDQGEEGKDDLRDHEEEDHELNEKNVFVSPLLQPLHLL